MVRTGIRTMIVSCAAALLLLPLVSASAQKKKTKAELANEKALADAQAAVDKAFDAWQDTAQWRTVTKDELEMTSEPRAPGASAIYLYTETERNNLQRGDMTYRQIKILTEEGRNLANVSLNFNQQVEKIRRIDARVIQPDGTIVPFAGEFYDRPVESNGQRSLHARSFTLPDVRVGSIIEVRYWRMFQNNSQVRSVLVSTGNGGMMELNLSRTIAAPPPRWMLNQQLFTRHAKYTLQLLGAQFVRWTFPEGLPAGTTQPKLGAGNAVRMEVRNMPAFVVEDYMPPPDDIVLSVDFSYSRLNIPANTTTAQAWQILGKEMWTGFEGYLGKPQFVRRRLDKIISKGDSTEQKVRKIYEYVRKMGNADLPGNMDEKTRKKCSEGGRPIWTVGEDGCGDTQELQFYFLALCRSAYIPAVPARVTSRRERFFTPETLDPERFDSLLVAVTIDGREVLLSPGLPFLPYGSLFWWDTVSPALKLDKDGGSWISTTVPSPADAVTHRKARLTLSEDGVLEGTIVVKHTGHEATGRVLSLLQADEKARADALKEDLRRSMAVPAEITVVRQPDWRTTDAILETEYRVKVPQWAVTSGNRLMVGIGLFGAEQVGKFVSTKREHPIYFVYPFTAEDELEITLPAGYKLQTAPAKQVSPDPSLKYMTSVESRGEVVSIRRSLTHNLLLAKQNQFPRVKSFYEVVRSGDQEQVVLTK